MIDASAVKRVSAYPLRVAAAVPPKLSDGARLCFVELDMMFDGGSHVADFRRNDRGILRLWFPHSGYWTSKAQAARSQPVGIMVLRNQKPGIVEIQRDSPLQKRIVELLTNELARDASSADKQKTLMRIRDRIQDRKPLREIAERLDRSTGEFFMGKDIFEPLDANPFE